MTRRLFRKSEKPAPIRCGTDGNLVLTLTPEESGRLVARIMVLAQPLLVKAVSAATHEALAEVIRSRDVSVGGA